MRTTDADALSRLLDGDPSVNGEASADVRAMAALATEIEQRATAPRPEFREALRARLLAEATAPRPPGLMARMRAEVGDTLARLRYSARAATASAVAAAMLASGGVAAATQMAVPGDLFHPLKTALEDVRIERADTVVNRGTLLLDKAESRIDEAVRATDAGRLGSAADALDAADEATREAALVLLTAFLDTGQVQAYEPLLSFIAAQRPRLDALAADLTGNALRALDDLHTSFSRIEARIGALGAGCCPQVFGDRATPGTPQPGVAFDFAHIPPADEPFDPCPCSPIRDAAPAPVVPTPMPDPTGEPGRPTTPRPGAATDPATPEPGPAQGDDADDGRLPAPPPGDVIDDPVDPVEEVIDSLPGGNGPPGSSGDPLRDVLERVIEDAEDAVDGVDDTVDAVDDALDGADDILDDVQEEVEDALEGVDDLPVPDLP